MENNFHSAEGANQGVKYKVLSDTSWFKIGRNGMLEGHPVNPSHPESDFKKDDVVIGKEKIVSYNIGKGWKKQLAVELSAGKYIPRSKVEVYVPKGVDTRQAKTCRHLNPDGTVTAYECPEKGSSFSGEEVVSKIKTANILIPAGVFGGVGLLIGILTGENAISLTVSGAIIGGAIGFASNPAEAKMSAEGKSGKTSKRINAGVKCCKQRDRNCKCTEYEYVKHGECTDAPC